METITIKLQIAAKLQTIKAVYNYYFFFHCSDEGLTLET